MIFNLNAIKKMVIAQGKNLFLRGLNSFANARFEQAKKELLIEVKNHPVSKELIYNTDPSEFLGGSSGTLFGFIGFPAGYNPIEELLSYLNGVLKFVPATEISLDGFTKVAVIMPTKEDFTARFPLFWEPGTSWVYGIEEGISGLGFYISVRSGRSQEGVQSNKPVAGKPNFVPVPFLTPLLNEMKYKLGRNN